MGTKLARPVSLPLLKLRLPIGGVASIVHRITGVLQVLLLPAAVYLLQLSLRDATGFETVRAWVNPWMLQLLLWGVAWLFLQHLLSGFRHLLLDLDIGVEKLTARRTAWLTFFGSILIVALNVIGIFLL